MSCAFPVLRILLASSLTLGALLTAAETTTIPAEHSPQRHAGFLEDIKAMRGGIDLVFVGDSITDGWRKPGKAVWEQSFAPLKALNLGSSGDRTEHVLWRLRGGELDGYQAKLFVVMIGTNNTKSGRDSPTAIANGVQAIVQEIRSRQPQAGILLLGIFPRGPRTIGGVADDGVKKMAMIRAVNADLAKRDLGERVRYLDISDRFLVDGRIPDEVMPDQLHPSATGYRIWADAVLPVITGMLGK